MVDVNAIQGRFVFFRYPDQDAQVFVESEGKDEFHFVDFQRNNPIIISGHTESYKADFKYNIENQRDPHHPIASFAEYSNSFENYKQAFREQGIRKAILSRIEKINLRLNDLHEIFQRLCDAYPTALVYCSYLADEGIWAGASPERLLKYQDGIASTVALAGTKASSDLNMWTSKEKEEHSEVEKYIMKIADGDRFDLVEKSAVYLSQAGHLFHLKSDFEFQVKESDIEEFLNLLHPTPAVCGVPLAASKKLIQENELHDRLYYSGYLGFKPKNNPGLQTSFEFYVNLRCVQIWEQIGYVFVGGGITEESKLEDEWQETMDKSNTIRSIIT